MYVISLLNAQALHRSPYCISCVALNTGCKGEESMKRWKLELRKETTIKTLYSRLKRNLSETQNQP